MTDIDRMKCVDWIEALRKRQLIYETGEMHNLSDDEIKKLYSILESSESLQDFKARIVFDSISTIGKIRAGEI